MESRFAAHARASLIAVLVAVVPATAAPKRGEAKKLFDKALTLYGKDDYKGAAAALEKSFKLQADADTLFAWAQAERKIGDCGKAIELYDKLLKFDLPAENRDAVSESKTECQQILGGATPPKQDTPPTPPTPPPDTTPPPSDTTPPPPTTTTTPPPTGAVQVQAKEDETPFGKGGRKSEGGGHAWWKDPVGDTLVIVGLGGAAVGTVLLVSASKASSDAKSATTFGDAETLQHRAHDQGQLGVIAAAGGAAFLVGGIVWYATHRHHDARPAVTGWLAPSSGGIAITGGF